MSRFSMVVAMLSTRCRCFATQRCYFVAILSANGLALPEPGPKATEEDCAHLATLRITPQGREVCLALRWIGQPFLRIGRLV